MTGVTHTTRMKHLQSARLALSTALLFAAAATAITPAYAEDGIYIPRLHKGKATVVLDQPTRLYECWQNLDGVTPRLSQRIRGKWRSLDTSVVTRDRRTCGAQYRWLAVFQITVTVPGKWNAEKGYYEARVRTTCAGCDGYTWKLPVTKAASPPPTNQVYYENCDEAKQAGAAPLLLGLPGYRPELDSDGDGVACELL